MCLVNLTLAHLRIAYMGGQSWGGQFWVHGSSGLPTSIITRFFNLCAYIRVVAIDFGCSCIQILTERFNWSFKKKCQVTQFVNCSLKGNGNEERYYDNQHKFFHCFVTYGQTHPYHPYHNNHQWNDYHRLNYGLLIMYTISGLRWSRKGWCSFKWIERQSSF